LESGERPSDPPAFVVPAPTPAIPIPHLDPHGSIFVIFRRPAIDSQRQAATIPDGPLPGPQEIPGPWHVSFDPKWGGPAVVAFEKLVDWRRQPRPEPEIQYDSGAAVYKTAFTYQPADKKIGESTWISERWR
jgi:hypothetical protein